MPIPGATSYSKDNSSNMLPCYHDGQLLSYNVEQARPRGFEKGGSGVHNQQVISGMTSENILQLNKFSQKEPLQRTGMQTDTNLMIYVLHLQCISV